MTTYQLTDGGVLRMPARGFIPQDADNGDWQAYLAWCEAGNVADPAPQPIFDPTPVGDECRRRIFAVASTNAQVNMAAARAAGLLSAEDDAAFAAGLGWINAMRGACAALIAAQDATFADDAHWPECPAAVVALAAKF